jgi:hypothetical protein
MQQKTGKEGNRGLVSKLRSLVHCNSNGAEFRTACNDRFEEAHGELQKLWPHEEYLAYLRFCSERYQRIMDGCSDICLADLEWEQRAPETGCATRYDTSFDRLRKTGFERHPRPAEAVGLMIAYLEGRLRGHTKDIARNMISSGGTFLDMTIERKGDLLVCYEDIEFVKSERDTVKGEACIVQYLSCSGTKEFDINGFPSAKQIDLSHFSSDFTQYFYGREYEDLPKQMRKGKQKATFELPPEGKPTPSVIGQQGKPFYIFTSECGHSRGVRLKQNS